LKYNISKKVTLSTMLKTLSGQIQSLVFFYKNQEL